MTGPYKDVRISCGIEGQLIKTRGDTDAVLTEIGFGGGLEEPEANISTDKDKQGVEENLSIRYSGLPRTNLYGQGIWSQYDIDLDERELEDGSLGFERTTDTDRNQDSYKIGFSTSPVRQVTLSAHYKRENKDNDYDHHIDTLPAGYSAFIKKQDITTDEVGTRLSLQPKNWIRTSLGYKRVDTEIETVFDNDHDSIKSGNYGANIYSLEVTLTPVSNLFLTSVQSYRDIRGAAFDNGVDSVISYAGDVFSSVTSASYALDKNNELRLDYTYARSDNFKDNADSGLPLLFDDRLQRVRAGFTRKLNDNIQAEIRYGYHDYEGSHNQGINDYSVHQVGISVSLDF